jgi:hypothetical protein
MSLGRTTAKRKASAFMAARRSPSARGRDLGSDSTVRVTTRKAFSERSASTSLAAAGLALWFTTASGIPAGPGSLAFTWKIWPKR